jgi:thioredoxin reductase (NADPH)
MRDVNELRPAPAPGDHHTIVLTDGSELRTRTVVLAMGVAYRRLGIPALEELTGTGVFYGASPSEAAQFTGGRVTIVGGGNSAGQAAVHLSRYAQLVTLVVRGPDLGASMSQYLVTELGATANVEMRLRTEVVDGGGDGRLEWLALRDGGGVERHEADALFVLIGALPRTAWLPSEITRDELGFLPTGSELGDAWNAPGRVPAPYETSVPGIFAVGDLRARSVKRVAAAVGEGSVVIQQVAEHLERLRRAAVH